MANMNTPNTITIPQTTNDTVIWLPNNTALKMIVHNAAVLLSVVPIAEPIKSTALYHDKYVMAPNIAIAAYLNT